MGRVRVKKELPLAEPASILVPRILNECQLSQGSHPRGIKHLVECRKNGTAEFLEVWIRCLQPLFLVSKREPAVERTVRFVATFTVCWDEENCQIFFTSFLPTLLDWAEAANKTVRFRACQMISEVVSKLEPHFVVDPQLWDRITAAMQARMQDRQASVRVFAASALARLVVADDIQNDLTVQAYRKALASDPSGEVRKMVVKSMPATNATVSDVVERIADVSELVRKASYQTIGERLCLPGLSITQRAMAVERGLAERVPAVRAESEKLLELWLLKECDGDPLLLLRFLDVETYEKAGEVAMLELFSKNLIKLSDTDKGLRQFLDISGKQPHEDRRMTAEEALYWRVLCTHVHAEAQEKGCEAANTGGAEAVVNAAVAAEQNEYLDSILLPTVADFVRLVEAHLHRGSAAWFAARQLLLLARLMDFTDSASRKDAAFLLQRLLRETAPSEELGDTYNTSSQEWVGDGFSLGGEESWANAVAELAHHVHASSGEFEEVLAAAVAEVGRPCREGGADVRQWLHCLAVTGLLLENITSLDVLDGQPIEPEEIVHSLLLPAVKHLHPKVQRAGVRCLGIYCGLERSLSPRAVEQLRLCLLSANPQVQKMAVKAMFDLILCHGAAAIDSAVGVEGDFRLTTPHPRPPGLVIPDFDFPAAQHLESRKKRSPLLELLVEWLYGRVLVEDGQDGTDYLNQATSIAAEGFAKVLLMNKRFLDVQLMQDRIVEELLLLYFSDTHSPRLKQCLAVFFRIWCSLSAENKRCISGVFIPVMRKKWPGIYEKLEKPGPVLIARKHATEVAHFMLHLLQLPVISKAIEGQNQKTPSFGDETFNEVSSAPDCDNAFDEGHESLAVRLCVEVKKLATMTRKFTSLSMAAKTYILMLCRVPMLLQFSASQQEKIKALLRLIPRVIEWLPTGEKTSLKALSEALARLKELDRSPDKGLTDEELELFMVRMGFHDKFKDESPPFDPSTPEPQTTSRTGGKSVSGACRMPANVHTPLPASTRSVRMRTQAQTVRSRTAQVRDIAPNTARKNLNSVYESSSNESASSTISSESGSDSETDRN